MYKFNEIIQVHVNREWDLTGTSNKYIATCCSLVRVSGNGSTASEAVQDLERQLSEIYAWSKKVEVLEEPRIVPLMPLTVEEKNLIFFPNKPKHNGAEWGEN